MKNYYPYLFYFQVVSLGLQAQIYLKTSKSVIWLMN